MSSLMGRAAIRARNKWILKNLLHFMKASNKNRQNRFYWVGREWQRSHNVTSREILRAHNAGAGDSNCRENFPVLFRRRSLGETQVATGVKMRRLDSMRVVRIVALVIVLALPVFSQGKNVPHAVRF